jgi:hypothetical protein
LVASQHPVPFRFRLLHEPLRDELPQPMSKMSLQQSPVSWQPVSQKQPPASQTIVLVLQQPVRLRLAHNPGVGGVTVALGNVALLILLKTHPILLMSLQQSPYV